MSRRLASIRISGELVAHALSPRQAEFTFTRNDGTLDAIPRAPFDAVRLDGGIPVGAKLVAAGINADAQLVLTFEHESFDLVEEGARPPALPSPRIETLAPGYCLWGHACAACEGS